MKPFEKEAQPRRRLFPREPAGRRSTHLGERAAMIQREILEKYDRASQVPLVMVRDAREPNGYRWENGPDPEAADAASLVSSH